MNSAATLLAYGGGKHGVGVTILTVVVLVAVVGGVIYKVVREQKRK